MYNLGNAKENLLVSKQKQNKYHDEAIKTNIHDKNDSHAILANLVKDKSVCLDMGCGPGYIGELLKTEKNCQVYGIEIDKEAIQFAKSQNCYEEIYDFSITDCKNKRYQTFFKSPLKFDYIILADLLEHIENPGEILSIFSKKLKKDGKILISIPNIAHMDISKNLIDRTFNYNTTGLLDNTHLRFFTKSSFLQMIDKINEIYNLKLHVKSIHKTIVVPSYASKYPHLYNLLNHDHEFCVLQYIYEIECSKTQIKNATVKQQSNFQKIENELQRIDLQQQEIENLKQQNEKIREECRNEIDKILNSKSWKVTAPLRKLMEFVSNEN